MGWRVANSLCWGPVLPFGDNYLCATVTQHGLQRILMNTEALSSMVQCLAYLT
jgi:hypothetical protein